MKKFLIALGMVFSLSAQAGLGSMLVGLAIGSASTPRQAVTKTDLQVQIDSIKASLPHRCKDSLTLYGACWGQFKNSFESYHVPVQKAEEIKSYFLNMGYSLRVDNDVITFDFHKEHEKYLIHKELPFSVESVVMVIFCSILPIWYLIVRYNYRQRVKHIKSLYEKDPEQIFFWDKGYKKQFEESLAKMTLPTYWNVNIKDEQIIGISYYNGRSMGRVASHKDSFNNMFKGILSKKGKN